MKILHTADLHLGSRLGFLSRDKAKLRNAEISSSFERLVRFAVSRNVGAILLCGDIFDSELPRKADKVFFYNVIRNTPGIDFYYLRGNHDTKTSHEEQLPNLKLFREGAWTSYLIGAADEGENCKRVTISGIESNTTDNESLYTLPNLAGNDFNIVMLHGQISDSNSNVGYLAINKFKDRNIDYLALGHIHTRDEGPLGERGRWAYSGCLEGRGFDEDGAKGFYLIDTVDGSCEFISSPTRTVIKLDMDISSARDTVEAMTIVRNRLRNVDPKNLVEIVIRGQVDFDARQFDTYLQNSLRGSFFHLRVRNRTQRVYHAEEFRNDPSLVGSFFRKVMEDKSLSEDMRNEILDLGLRVLKDGED